MKLGILKSWEHYHHAYIGACQFLNVEYKVIDILASDWITLVKDSQCDGFLAHPPCDIQERKSIYDEKLYFLSHFMKKKIYPTFDELYIYENKRNMSYFLETFDYPHPKTRVFSRREDAMKFLEDASFPLAFKSNIGSGASGVSIIKSKNEAVKFINQVFGRFHKLITLGKLYWGKHKGIPLPKLGIAYKHYIIIQDFYKIRWEWRIIKIGNSYAGHQKLLKGEFASGSDMVGWIAPPKELLNLVKRIAEEHGFYSVAIDIFETENGEFLINEVQSLFGSYLPYQMKVDGVPGIYEYKDNDFIFYNGEFHQDSSKRLRVKHFLEILNRKLPIND